MRHSRPSDRRYYGRAGGHPPSTGRPPRPGHHFYNRRVYELKMQLLYMGALYHTIRAPCKYVLWLLMAGRWEASRRRSPVNHATISDAVPRLIFITRMWFSCVPLCHELFPRQRRGSRVHHHVPNEIATLRPISCPKLPSFNCALITCHPQAPVISYSKVMLNFERRCIDCTHIRCSLFETTYI